jgi:hypothetical protein
MYYMVNNDNLSPDNADKAKCIFDQEWKNRIYKSQFIIYIYANQEGEKLGSGQSVASILQTIVIIRFFHTFDFTNNITES